MISDNFSKKMNEKYVQRFCGKGPNHAFGKHPIDATYFFFELSYQIEVREHKARIQRLRQDACDLSLHFLTLVCLISLLKKNFSHVSVHC